MLNTLKIIVLIMGIPLFTQGQSPSLQKLVKDEKTELSLYFYPSTLRMVNLQRNAEFDELIKDIDKLTFLKLDRHAFDHQQFIELVQKLEQKEKMEEYIVVEGKDQKLYVLGRENPAATIGLAYFQKEYYAMDVAGEIQIKNLPKLYEQLSQNDSTFRNGFVNVFQVMTEHRNNINIDD